MTVLPSVAWFWTKTTLLSLSALARPADGDAAAAPMPTVAVTATATAAVTPARYVLRMGAPLLDFLRWTALSPSREKRVTKNFRHTLRGVASDEHALVQRLQNGDEAAFVEVVESYHPRLLRFAAGLVGSWTAAEDVVQDTWVAVIRGVE